MMSLFAFYWRGDEYDLSSWQGWLKILAGLILWTIVSGMARSASQQQRSEAQKPNPEVSEFSQSDDQDVVVLLESKE